MNLSDEDRRALGVILALLTLAGAARWLERPRPVLDELEALDVAALESASRAARPAAGRAQALRAGERIDPNKASPAELQRLPGVGAATAQRIVEERERAPFETLSDLQRVRGIGPALSARLAEHVTLPEARPGARGSPGPAVATSQTPRTGGPPGRSAATSQTPGTGGPPGRSAAASPSPGAAGAAASTMVDLNRASAAELQALPGIGPALAARLVTHRDSLGGFRNWDDVDAVPGIGPALLARLQERARVGRAP